MPGPILAPEPIARALGRPLDVAERAALLALEEGVPLPPGGAAPASPPPAPAAELAAPADLGAVLLDLLATGPAGPAAVLARPGVALAIARGGPRARLDPRRGGALAALDAAAWLACRGAAPERAAAALGLATGPADAAGWRALAGCGEACLALGVNLGIPRGSSRGAVEALDAAPGAHAGEPGSLAVAMSGQAEGERATGFVADGDAIALLGAVGGGGSMGGSAYALHLAGAAGAGGEVPEPDLAAAGAVLQVVRRAVQGGLLSSARPVGRGGLGVALAEACAASGAAVRVPYGWAKERVLFGEEPGRVLVSLAAGRLPALEALAREGACPLVRLGAVGGDRLEVQAALSAGLDALLAARRTAAAGAGDAPDDTARA